MWGATIEISTEDQIPLSNFHQEILAGIEEAPEEYYGEEEYGQEDPDREEEKEDHV